MGSGRQVRMTLRVISAKGRRRSQRSSGKSGWVEEKTEIRWFFPVRTALSAGLDLWVCWGTNVTGSRCKRKYSRHSNEVSLSTMRLGRGWEWAVKKARIDAKEET